MLNALQLTLCYALGAGLAPRLPSQLPPVPYLGEWEYRTDSTAFRVRWREQRNYPLPSPADSTLHLLLGSYRFSRRGVTVEETFTRPDNAAPLAILGPGYERQLRLVFQDQVGLNHMQVLLRPKPGAPDVLIWTRENWLETVRINDHRPARFALPARFELVRVR